MIDSDLLSERLAFGVVRDVYARVHWFPARVPDYPWSACGATMDTGKPDLSSEEGFGGSSDDCPQCTMLWYGYAPSEGGRHV